MRQAEDRHWWYAGMEHITRALLKRWLTPASQRKILDAGCGTGGAIQHLLSGYGQVTGIDLSSLAVQAAQSRGLAHLVQGTVLHLPFANQTFALVTSFDVLYERSVPDDLQAASEFFRVLQPGGQALIRVPAFEWLRGQHDEVVHTARRYNKPQFRNLLEQAGFQVQHITCANLLLLPLVFLKRASDRISPAAHPESDLADLSQTANRTLAAILATEAPLAANVSLPVGVSLVAIAQKNQHNPDVDKKIPSLSVFFPAYNDAGTIASMVLAARIAARQMTDDFEIIVVNDGSHDHTAQVLEELAGLIPELRVIDHGQNRGYGAALRSGFTSAQKEWVFYTDGDAQYNPLELHALAQALQPGTDIVNGYKISRNDPLIRIILGRIYHHTVSLMFGLRLRDVDCDFRLMRRAALEKISLESDTGTICVEMVRKLQDAGCPFAEVPVHHYHRQYGRSQFFNWKRLLRTARHLLVLWVKLAWHKQSQRSSAK
jgi:2-polyprenyl-3-methyl-5-hydroxy-6-metoxy-1,4-benzoquinol methylase